MRVLACLALIASPALAEDVRSARVAEVVAGIVCAPEVTDHVPAPGTVAGVTNIIDAMPPFISDSRVVPAVIGVGMAITSRAGKQDIPLVTMQVRHPPMGEAGATLQTYDSSIWSDGSSFTIYQFDFDYELVEGPWSFTAVDLNGDTLWHVEFEVVDPQLVPDLAAPCGYTDLLS